MDVKRRRVAITGHRDLSAETGVTISRAFDEYLSRYGPVVAVSSLAEGADQLWARAALRHGGELDAIVPSHEYRGRRVDIAGYDGLVAAASRVTRLPWPEDGPHAHMAASLVMVERSDLMLAVWDGKPARSFAGTADVVGYARQVGVPVTVIWPTGAARES
jgi:hypothetical protein